MKVTFDPEHMVVELAEIVTEGVTLALTVIVIPLEVAVGCVTQARDVVMITVTTSLLVSPAF